RDTWSVLAGVKKIFWGVAETVNHVDIINTRDLADDLNGDRKLGQPMLKFDLFNEWGNFQFYTLPYFRQPTYPSSTSRLGLGFDIETAQPIYQSTEKESHIDYAFRWAHSLNIVDLGLSYFTGTGREPILIPDTITGKLVPHYFLITQYGLDFQVTFETVLLKLEYIERSGLLDETYQAYTTGFEYSFYSLFGTNVDVGIVSEYVYNGFSKASFITPFEDDLFLGVRVALNDTQSSEMLAGVFHDLSGEGNVFSLEASRRISEEYKVILKANIYHDISKNDLILYSIANDDNIQGELIYYF
ncbi:MAG: hypothetical protein OEX00_10625, partial [Gammaproteobacteria bacterium]|nr:hypothetical protein [Gammaproteobacteria bacterium]